MPVSKGKVLIVDDEVYILHILDFSLNAEGYEVVTAENGDDGLDRYKRERPDLVVLDVMMPRLDGYETTRKIREYEKEFGMGPVPVILLTAKGRGIDRKLGLEVGADDYISKPFYPRKLIDKIGSFLD